MIMGKIRVTNEWRLLRYLDTMLAQELFPIVKGENVRYVSEDLPFPVLVRIWNDSKKIRELSVRYASRSSTSGASARTQDLPYLFALCASKRLQAGSSRGLWTWTRPMTSSWRRRRTDERSSSAAGSRFRDLERRSSLAS